MDPSTATVLTITLLLVLLAMGVHIAFSLFLAGIVGLTLLYGGPSQALSCLGLHPFSYVNSVMLVVVPLFILLGHFAFFAGVTRGLYEFAYKWVGKFHGGLAMASVLACAGFSAVTGSSAATAATIGKIALPEMKRYGYDNKLATGAIASAGTLGNLIPPSIILVVYGFVTGESIGALLIAGIFPGIVSALIYMIMIYLRCRINPSLAALAPKVNWRERLISVRQVWGMLTLFLIVMGSIYLGIATPTEAGGVGTFAALLIAVAMRSLSWSNLREALLEAGKVTAMVFAIVMGAAILSVFLTASGAAPHTVAWIGQLQVHRMWILIGLLFLYIPLGMFLEPIAMMLITLPLVYPIITMQLGFDGVWFGIMFVKMAEIGMITPPVGINVYVIKGIAPEVKLEEIFHGCGWFVIMDIVTIAILIMFPQIVLWLPGKMMT